MASQLWNIKTQSEREIERVKLLILCNTRQKNIKRLFLNTRGRWIVSKVEKDRIVGEKNAEKTENEPTWPNFPTECQKDRPAILF